MMNITKSSKSSFVDSELLGCSAGYVQSYNSVNISQRRVPESRLGLHLEGRRGCQDAVDEHDHAKVRIVPAGRGDRVKPRV